METKGITCKIPLDLHNRVSEEIRETESTISKFIEMVIMEHYEKGAVKVMEKGRTLAFQVSEELFQRVKEYLENYEKIYRRLTQKEFVIGLIEQALEEAEEEFEAARAAEHEEQAESGWEAAESPETDEDEEVPDDEGPEGWDDDSSDSEAPAEDEGPESEEIPVEDDEDAMPESWEQDDDEEEETEPADESPEDEETAPDDDTVETGETNENEEEAYA